MASSKRYPTLFIESNWNDSLRLPNTEVWISSKYLNELSTHGTIKSSFSTNEDKLKYYASDGFHVQGLSLNTIIIKHISSDLITAFVAPMKSFNIHKKAIHSVSAAENALVVSSSEDDKVYVWDSRTGDELLCLTGHGGPAYKCKFFPSGVVALTAGADGSLKVWSAENGVCPVTLIGHKMAVTDMDVVDRGRNVISVSKDGKAKLWDVGEAKCLGDIVSSEGFINCCCLVSTSNVQPVENPREVGTGDKLVVIGCENGTVYCTHIALREMIFVIKLDSPVNVCAAINTDVLVGCENGKVILISTENGSILNELWESSSPVVSLISLPNSKYIVGRQDGCCVIHSLLPQHSGMRVQLTGPPGEPIRSIAFNGRWVFTGSRDSVVRKYDCNQLSVHFK